MKSRVLCGVAVLVGLSVCTSAVAQVGKGMNELVLSGGIDVNDAGDDTDTSFNLGVGYGRLFTDRIELGGSFDITKVEDVDPFGSIGAFGEYHFGDIAKNKIPYIGAQVAAGYSDNDDNPVVYGFYGGLKWFLGAGGGGAVRLEPFYDRVSIGDFDYNTYGIRWGISIWF